MTPTTLAPCLVAALALAAPAPAQPRNPRGEMERLAAALEAAVRQVSLPSGEPLIGGEPARGYYVAGVGAVFVVPPRSVPRQARVRLLRPGRPALDLAASDLPDYAALEELLGPEGAREFAEQQRRQDSARRSANAAPPSAQELRALEEREAAFQREAEAARREFERLVDQMMRQAQVRLGAPRPKSMVPQATADAAPTQGATVPGTPADDAAPGTPGPPPRSAGAPPPWHLWTRVLEDTRTPERIVSDVRDAVVATLAEQGVALSSLAPGELVSVAVDFVPRALFSTAARPAHTLVVRVPKQALDERAAGRLTRDEFERRVQVSEY